MTKDSYLRSQCRMCDGSDLVHVMSLTPTPPGTNFVAKEALDYHEPRYPLDLYLCNRCHHVQLGHVVDPQILYQNDYLYVSGTSNSFVKHLEVYATGIVERFRIKPGSLVADIGSNDGTCLRRFQDLGMDVVGIDPAREIADRATDDGIPTVPAFFSLSLAQELRNAHGSAALITSHNACAHIDRLDDVMRGVSCWLADGGIFVLEVGYFVDVFEKLLFDTIYHEHLDYHTVEPFEALFERTGMQLLSVQRIEPQGGSIRVIAQKIGGPFKNDNSANALIRNERTLALDEPSTFAGFGQRIASSGEQLRRLIRSLKREGKSIAAYGAPTKATTLLTHFGVGAESLDFTVDDNPLKQGKYLPMSHIPIVSRDELCQRSPDFVLILAWNFAEPIMAMNKSYIDQGGRFILPMPEPRIV